MAAAADSLFRPRPSKRGTVVIVAVVLVIVVALAVVFFGVGRWLVVEDPLQKAQAIAVLSGGMPQRAREAAQLFRESYALEIWLTRPQQPAASLDPMGIPNSGEDYFNARVLGYEGVPAAAIRILDPAIHNTADEIRVIAAQAARENAAAIILVTHQPHTRRVRSLWRQLGYSRTRLIVRAARTDSFDAVHWWRHSQDAWEVVREVLGLLNAWTGLPLRPAN